MAYFTNARKTIQEELLQSNQVKRKKFRLKYAWSDTRPCMSQLNQFTKAKIHLKPILPLSPMRSVLNYHAPSKTNHGHVVMRCSAEQQQQGNCIMCQRYQVIYQYNLKRPAIPCSRLRKVYLLFHVREDVMAPFAFDPKGCHPGKVFEIQHNWILPAKARKFEMANT